MDTETLGVCVLGIFIFAGLCCLWLMHEGGKDGADRP